VPRIRTTRLLAIGAIALVGFLYWKPMHSYMRTKREVQSRSAQVAVLRAERQRLEKKIARANTAPELIRQGRFLGLVRPGERLFIVRGIPAWRRNH
jgi:type II secretory pathway component PulJ